MKINVKATHISLTPAISAYIEEKVNAVEKFVSANDPDSVMADVEVGMPSKHHQTGDDIFRAEINLHIGGVTHRAVSEKDDLYAAIDEMKDEVVREIVSAKEKERTLERKGGSLFKRMLRGFRG